MTLKTRVSRRARGAVLHAELLEDRQLLSTGGSLIPGMPVPPGAPLPPQLQSVAMPLPLSVAISFSGEFYTASAQTGTASITLQNNQFPGPAGSPTTSPEQVYLSFGSGTAVPGVDYAPGGQTVNFSSGQTSATVQLPILPGSASEGTRVVELDLSATPGSTPFAAAFLAITHNSDTTPPTVVASKAITKGSEVTGFVIKFSKDMARGPVQDLNNYAIESPSSMHKVRSAQWPIAMRLLPIKSAVYDSRSHSVTLTLRKGARKYPYFTIMDRQTHDLLNQVVLMAAQLSQQNSQTIPPAPLPQISSITDSTGNPLDSTHSGTPDGTLFTVVRVGKAGKRFLEPLSQPAPLLP
jgi:hypothetical protein